MALPAFRHAECVENAYKAALANAYTTSHVSPGAQYDCYPRQHRPIEVIQLVEVAPPIRPQPSVPCSSTAPSSYASSSSSSSSSSEDKEELESESYCSSEDDDEIDDTPRRVVATSSDTRIRRIELWRDAYAKAVGAEFAPSPSRTKRKNEESDDEDDDTLSRSSKRSRQSSLSTPTSVCSADSVRSVHSCSACDAWFPDRGSLRKHGFDPLINEACKAAVEYDFEP